MDEVWQHSTKLNGFEYAESPEFFLFHHIAHMAYHFIHGGCGIRSFIDLWIFENKIDIDDEKYRALLKQANLEKFEKYAFDLMHYWLDNGEPNEQILMMEHYILTGSTYGSNEKSVVIGNYKAGSKFKYFLNRIFMPLRTSQRFILSFINTSGCCRFIKFADGLKFSRKEKVLNKRLILLLIQKKIIP